MKVTVYSKPACPQCFMVKRLLDDKGIEYKEINSLDSEETIPMLKEKYKASQLPVTLIEKEDKETVIIGNRVTELREAIA